MLNKPLQTFKNIDDHMIWKGAALRQIAAFEALAERLDVELHNVSAHRSKSIELPVVKLTVRGTDFFIRDNFYDQNVCIVAPEPIDLTLSQILRDIQSAQSWDWYLNEIARCRNYTWNYFTDEEMDDPRLLRVFKLHKHAKPGDKPMEWSVNAAQKDRWLKRMTDPVWWTKDWSSGTLSWSGAFAPGVEIFIQPRPYMQGIEEVVPSEASKPFQPGCRMFALALDSLTQVEALIRNITRTHTTH